MSAGGSVAGGSVAGSSGGSPGAGALEASLRRARSGGRKLLVPYVTGGLGVSWLDLVAAMADAGADAVEVGLPFSDPVMDGPTIQAASMQALRAGATPGSILADLRRFESPVPLVAMTYYNLVERAGHHRFVEQLRAAGLAGAIVPDLPLEEAVGWEAAALEAGIETVLLAAPVTPDKRLSEICRRTRGFVYGVNLMGVTGERALLSAASSALAKRLKAITDKPVVMGFGISTPAQAVAAVAESDGVVVASALMRMVMEGATLAQVAGAVAAMREALDQRV